MAPLALILWPFLSGLLFATMRLQIALVATILGGFLLLPTATEFDLPVLPRFDKHSIPALSALFFCIIFVSRQSRETPASAAHLSGWVPRNQVVLVCLAFLCIGPFFTALVNRAPLVYGPLVLPGLRPYDAFSAVLATLTTIVPFLLARKFLASVEGHRLLITGTVVAASAYAFLALYEVRMSPQLNNMIYGFFPHTWLQHVRAGGWRPLVFLSHGLVLAIFLTIAFICAVGMARNTTGRPRMIWFLIAAWLLATLVLAKSLGALLIAVLMFGVIVFLPRRLHLTVALGIAVSVLVFPALRANGLVPVDQILAVTESVSAERAESFKWRLDNEQMLLNKANEQALFGWGGWGRNRVFSETTGRDLSTTDGSWIIELGIGGWARYIGIFGLLSWGIIALCLRLSWGIIAQLRRRHRATEPLAIIASLALASNLIDLIPNSGVTPLTWMLAGALCGRLEKGAVLTETDAVETIEPSRRLASYSRSLGAPPEQSEKRSQRGHTIKPADRQKLPYRRKF